MGLFDRYKKTDYSYIMGMREYLKNFMLDYIEEFPSSADEVILICSAVDLGLCNTSTGEIRKINKFMEENHINVELGVLNLLQNSASRDIKKKTGSEFISGEVPDYAYDLFIYINKLKYKKGYIDKKQRDENELWATKVAIFKDY